MTLRNPHHQLSDSCSAVSRAAWFGLIATCAVISSCNTSGSKPEQTAATTQRVIVNGGFEAGSLNSWTVSVNSNPGIQTFPPATVAELGLTVGGCNTGGGSVPCVNVSRVVSSATTGYPSPDGLASADSLKYPFHGAYSAVVNDQGKNRNVNTIKQTATMSAADVDVTDGKIHLRFAAAPVLQNPEHDNYQQPYFFLDITNTTTGTQLFHTFNFSNQPGVNWLEKSNDSTILYTNWQAFDIVPSGGALNIGDSVAITVIGAGCSLGAHWGEIYVDEFGTSFAQPNVGVTAPAFVKQNQDLTYTVTAKNGGGSAATNTTVMFATPMLTDSTRTGTPPTPVNTTFVTLDAPGASCIAPNVGQSGQITCNLGTLGAGVSSTFTVTVHVPNVPGGFVLPAFVNEGTYTITSTETPIPLTGNLVQTQVTTNTPVDLQTTLSDGVASLHWGQPDTYTLVVKNNGPVDVTGVTVKDTQPSAFSGTMWTCSATGGATCASVSGSGPINKVSNLPVGSSVTYLINTTVNGTGPDKVVYTATATPPAGYVQSVAFNNTATDVDNNDDSVFNVAFNKDPAGNGQGKVVVYPGGFTCDTACSGISEVLSNNLSIAVSASTVPGSSFVGWTGGGCTGTTNPCVTNVTANATILARFDELTVTPSIVATSNGNSTDVRPGDTVDYKFVLNVPNNFAWPIKLSNVLPTGLNYVSHTSTTTSGTITCAVGSCTNPTVSTGATSTFDFGNVACTTAGGCTITLGVRAQVATDQTRGTQLVDTVSATNVAAQNLPALNVIEPNLTIARAPAPSSGMLPGQTSTVTVTLSNAGAANAAVVGAAVTTALPAHVTAGNYQAGTCPAAVATFGANSASFVFADTSTTLAVGASCYFTYDVTLANVTPGNTTINVPAATVTTQSLPGSAPPAKVYSASDAGFAIATAPLANGQPCTSGNNCASNVCDIDLLCGYADGDGPCAANTGASVCRSGKCSALLVCAPAGGCLADADCTAAQFCNTDTHLCAAKLTNGQTVPVIANHTPVLNGVCSVDVAAAVCVSAVCDIADNACGYADGDGHCTDADAAIVCRSGVCSKSGVCGIAGGCLVDTDCAASEYCNTPTHACVAKWANGSTIPTVQGHTPTLDGICNVAAAAVVCVSGVCDGADNKCGYADGDGQCSSSNLSVCRSGVCALSGVCGGCAVDSDCAANQYCNTPEHACTPKLDNGVSIPSVNGHTPTLDGTCTAQAGSAVCASGVCDIDGKCGYADGDGTCNAANVSVCRSGVCSAVGVCGITDGCLVDGDCPTTHYCDTQARACTPKLPNGTVIPSTAGHNPILNGTCTDSVAGVVCVSGACDVADNKCGYADGDGVCNSANLAVCRSGVCSTAAVCGVANGCIVDADCAASQYCDTPNRACVPKLVNGTTVPTVLGHSPEVKGTCTAAAALVVCQSAVCDTADNKCGYADGDGTCTSSNLLVCRSGVCSTAGVCGVRDGCVVDGDCTSVQYCNTPAHTCAPKVVNGGAVPTVTGHNPPLTGVCSAAAAAAACMSATCDATDNACGLLNGTGPCTASTAAVCRSGACDPDNKCGYADGDGPCTSANAATVCRSQICSASGNCAPKGGCLADADCAATQFCNTASHQCTDKLVNGTTIPTVTGHNPVLNGTCSSAAASAVCASGVCDVDNACGYGDGNGSCSAGNATVVCRSGQCNAKTGACGTDKGCSTDAECAVTQFCNTQTAVCVTKLDNGTSVPSITGHTPVLTGTCTTEVGAAVCASGVCAADNLCGYPDGIGPCTSTDAATLCRSGVCNSAGVCGTNINTSTATSTGTDAGTLEGGGCNCRMAPRHSGNRSLFALAALFGFVLAARRRRHLGKATRRSAAARGQ